MKRFAGTLITVCLFICNGYSEEVLLLESIACEAEPNCTWVFWVDAERLSKTPSWNIGESMPLSRESLMSIVEKTLPDVQENVCSIDLRRVGETESRTGTPLVFNSKWYYNVTWQARNERGISVSRSLVILLDGTKVMPSIKTEHILSHPRSRKKSMELQPTVKTPVESEKGINPMK